MHYTGTQEQQKQANQAVFLAIGENTTKQWSLVLKMVLKMVIKRLLSLQVKKTSLFL